MSVKGRVIEGRRWLRWVREDLDVATHGLTDSTSRPRHACSHAQQAAEKSPKAALLLAGRDFPYSHDLEILVDLLPGTWPERLARVDLETLTQWAVEGRYPDYWREATEADAEKAVADAKRVHELVRAEFNRLTDETMPREERQN